MPRNNLKKLCSLSARNKASHSIETTENPDLYVEGDKDVIVKLEAEDTTAGETLILDFNRYKFERKSHVKIEYDKESPKKEDAIGLWEPANWKEFLENLRVMRSKGGAPVDSMGCHKTMDENAPPEVMRYQSLIALMLSSQTKDQVTFAAMERLRARGLTIDGVLEMSDDELGQLIYPVGFWKTKIKYIKKTTQTLKEQYNGDIPDSVEKLCKLTGVGPKMAHICMSVAWNKVTGIGVDTHVHRISNRIGWVKKPTSTPEDTRKALQSWLPFDLWGEVNHLLVGFGQTICQPISPLCNDCLNKDICPSSGLGRKSPNKKSPKKTPVKEEGSDNEFQVKKENFLIVPKKETKKKVIPINNDLKIENRQSNLVTQNKKTNKRKITPKKNELYVQKDDNDFEEKRILDVPKKTIKGKVTPNKNVEIENNYFEVQNEDKDENIKRKVAPVNEDVNKINQDNPQVIRQKVSTDENTESKTLSVQPKLSVKRKSPRNRTIKQNIESTVADDKKLIKKKK